MLDAPDTAVLAVNLGTPETPTAPAVRRYLAEFLSDPRVVAIPPLLWKPLLYGLILPLRSGRSAAKYAQVWLPDGSPLMVHTRRLAEAMQALMPNLRVRYAMRYGAPALTAELDRLAAEGMRRIVVLPLYPQYSTTTTASIEDQVRDWQPRHPGVTVTLVRDYAVDPDWVAAVAASIRQWWAQHGRGEKLVFSFHGIPQRLADAGDPYPQRCEASAEAIAQALELGADDWQLTYQRASAARSGCSRTPNPRCGRWLNGARAASTWCAPALRPIAWKHWRKWPWGSPKPLRRAAPPCATSPASTMRPSTPWRCRG